MQARIIKIVSKEYTLLDDNMKKYNAILMGKVRLQVVPSAGDFVEFEEIDGRCVIQKILPRVNKLIRPSIANVDQAIIVMSTKDPDFSIPLIDRLSMLIMHEGIKPILCVTKCDLDYSDEVEKAIQEYEKGPMKVIRTAKTSLDPSIASILENKVSVLTGQSGAGKSTLLNTLEPSFHLATQEISKALGRGKHTTRHNELHIVGSGLVADTPGFSSLDFSHIEKDELAYDVMEFEPYLNGCRFNDCIHENEPGCLVKEALEKGEISRNRYNSYIEVLRMIKSRREKY